MAQIHQPDHPTFPKNTPITGGPLTKEKMIDYLNSTNDCDCVVTMLYPTIVKKSYPKEGRNEKRFFCPPPSVYLTGDGWKDKRRKVMEQFQQMKENQQPQNGLWLNVYGMEEALKEAERASNLCVYIGVGGEMMDIQPLDFSDGKDYAAAKNMSIDKSDERKFIEISVQLFYSCGIDLGCFSSQRIKVISKPPKMPKKIQNIKKSDGKYMLVASGSTVGLYNRTKSQTRILHFENNSFHASSTKWSAFNIYIIDATYEDLLEEQSSVPVKDGYVCYGSKIKIIDSETGIALPYLRIRKFDGNNVDLNPSTNDEAVSSFHKCAFEIVGEPGSYLSISHNKIVQHKATSIDDYHYKIVEEAVWNIVLTEKVEYRFYEAMGPVQRSITPVPIATGIEVAGAENLTRVTITGFNLTTNLTIWFGATAADTAYRSNESLTCMVPPFSTVCRDMRIQESPEVPISLVRDDGVVYSTNMTFSYKNTLRQG